MGQVYELAQAPKDNEVARFPFFLARAKYAFAVDGGAVGDINLLPSAVIPSGALILGCLINVITVPTSGGAATVALKAESAADLNAADAISGAPWSTTGFKWADLTFATNPVKPSALRNITATIGTADLTAGEFDVVVFFLAPGLA